MASFLKSHSSVFSFQICQERQNFILSQLNVGILCFAVHITIIACRLNWKHNNSQYIKTAQELYPGFKASGFRIRSVVAVSENADTVN